MFISFIKGTQFVFRLEVLLDSITNMPMISSYISLFQVKWVMPWMAFCGAWRLWGSRWEITDFNWTLIRRDGCGWDPLYPRIYHCWSWMRLHYPTVPVCNLENLLDSRLLLHCVPVMPLPGQGGLPFCHSCFGHLLIGLLQPTLPGATFEKYLEASTV